MIKFFVFIAVFLLCLCAYKLGDKNGFDDGIAVNVSNYIEELEESQTRFVKQLDSLKTAYYRLYFSTALNKCPEDWK